jgi:hypothetical protein
MFYQPEFLLLISRERQRDMFAEAERARLLRHVLRRRGRAVAQARDGGEAPRRRPGEAGLSVPASTLTSCEAPAGAPAR